MRWAVQALAVAGLLAVGAALVGMRNAGEAALPPPESIDALLPELEAEPEMVEEAPAVAAGPPRSIADDLVALPQVRPEELVRVAPREPLSRFGQPLPPKRKNQGRLFRPVVMDAGTVVGSGLIVTIAGVVVTPEGERCTDAAGVEWPCGVRARTALRSFVRGRALACDLPEEITAKAYTITCSLGKVDVGHWLVEQGWAKASPGGPYENLGRDARTAARGIFAAAPSAEPLPGIVIPPPAASPVADIMPPLDAGTSGTVSSSVRP